MIRIHRMVVITGLLIATLAQAQAPANRPPPEPPVPLLFKEAWKPTPTPAAALLSQSFVANPDLLVTVYGPVAPDLNSANGEPHVWTGMCKPACGVTLKMKDSLADLTGKAHVTWKSRTSGFHQIRPLVKLADGTMLVGNFADENDFDYRLVDFHLATVRWLALDAATLTTKGTLLPAVDLSKVDEVGFIDLTPGSGHGFGGYSALGFIEVYGKAVARK
ncbi:MAG: hypothetical protein U1F39_07005 [Steroidobacteraceae bacterium]